MSSEELVRTMTMRLASAGVQESGLTLRATIQDATPLRGSDALRTVKAIAAGTEPPLSILSTLGEGGMGIVQLGTQRSLGREVAIKTLRAGARSDDAVARLVREAVVTGSLEHPNVVPVYELSVGPEGVPVLVMKRVEGSTWTARMHDEAHVEARSGAGDLLEWNLRTLMSVCQGVHFAHSRGVVHRDLKPDNVMIGGFGEIYLVDWGIAVRVAGGEVPESTRGGKILGTPAYMAPEMLLCEPITPHTDIYLLGALLYEILAGRAPHEVEGGLSEVVRSVLGPVPSLPASAPKELADLVVACMQRDPAERPPSAESVHQGLADFLRHRGSAALARRAEERARELEALLCEVSPRPDHVQRLYGEVSFGFRAALEAWPENAAARGGSMRATRALVRFELAHGMHRAARARLADLLEPDEALHAEVDEANARADEAARRDAALRSDLDPHTGRRSRLLVTLLVGLLWTVQPLAQQAGLLGPGAETHLAGAVMALAGGAVLAVSVFVLRRFVFGSRMNRALVGVAILVVVAQVVAYAGAWLLGIPASTTQTLLVFAWFCVVAVLAMAFELRLLVGAGAFLVAFGVAAAAPRFRLYAESAANGVLMLTAIWTWGSRARPGATSPAAGSRPSQT